MGSLDVSTIEDITTRARKAEKIVQKEAKQKNADAQKNSVTNASVSNSNKLSAITELLSHNYIYIANSGIPA